MQWKAKHHGEDQKAEKKQSPQVGEKNISQALQAFLITLPQGGKIHQWQILSAMVDALGHSVREMVIRRMVVAIKQIERSKQQRFMENLTAWKAIGDDDLATWLWLRLRFLASAQTPVINEGDN
jgi:hypothetical protein